MLSIEVLADLFILALHVVHVWQRLYPLFLHLPQFLIVKLAIIIEQRLLQRLEVEIVLARRIWSFIRLFRLFVLIVHDFPAGWRGFLDFSSGGRLLKLYF